METKKLIILLLASCMYVACSEKSPSESNQTESKSVSGSEDEHSQPSNLITLDKAKEQLDFYNEAHPLEVGSEYALRTWISIEELKAYIAYVEKKSEQKGIKVSGIDFIHTQYKRAVPGSANPDNSVYDKTLMLAPTYKSGNSNIAFDPLYSQQDNPKDLKTILEEMESDTIQDEGYHKGGQSSIANSLQSCPNRCN